jgi:alpha-D-ribose 1-methylphosphonate 5-triphosphate synthase subunit PhnH
LPQLGPLLASLHFLKILILQSASISVCLGIKAFKEGFWISQGRDTGNPAGNAHCHFDERMQEEKQNPVFALWLAAYEEQLMQLAQRTGQLAPHFSPAAPGAGPEVTSE